MKVVRDLKQPDDVVFKPPTLPETLDAGLLREMERAHANGGMRAAYRLLLDNLS
jgi:hypothetical protein